MDRPASSCREQFRDFIDRQLVDQAVRWTGQQACTEMISKGQTMTPISASRFTIVYS